MNVELLPALVTDSTSILRCQNRLESELKSRGEAFEGNYRTRGFQRESVSAYYFSQYDFYWKSGDSTAMNRYWNSFGIGKPLNLFDAFQINIPKKGVDRRVRGGLLARGQEIFLLHRGPLGGGRKDGSHDLCAIVPDLVDVYDDAGASRQGIVFPLFASEGSLHPDFFEKVAMAVRAVATELARS